MNHDMFQTGSNRTETRNAFYFNNLQEQHRRNPVVTLMYITSPIAMLTLLSKVANTVGLTAIVECVVRECSDAERLHESDNIRHHANLVAGLDLGYTISKEFMQGTSHTHTACTFANILLIISLVQSRNSVTVCDRGV